MSVKKLDSDWLVAPGEILRETLVERRWTQTDLAAATNYSQKHVSLVCSGLRGITVEFALTLERVLNIDAEFWLNLETTYRLGLARGRKQL